MENVFLTPINNEEETCKQIIEMGRKIDYTTDNLLNYEYFSKHYKLIAVDLREQIKLESPDLKQKNNFIDRLERNEGATMLLIIEKSGETIVEFIQSAEQLFDSGYI